MIRAPAITTAIRIPVLVARIMSACSWRISFLILDVIEKTKTRRTMSPGINSGFSSRPVAVVREMGRYLGFGTSPDVSFAG